MHKARAGAVYCENFYWPGHYAFVPNETAWKAELKRLNEIQHPFPKSPGNCCALWNERGHVVCLITVAEDITAGASVACILAHEATHVWQKIAVAMGEEKPGLEQEAYAIQQITRGLLEAFEATRHPLFLPAQDSQKTKRKTKRGRRNV